MDARIRASPRHGGASKLWHFSFTLTAAGGPIGGGGIHRTFPHYIWILRFLLNLVFKVERSRGFHHRRCGSPQSRYPRTGITSCRITQCIMEDRHCLSFIIPGFCIPYHRKIEKSLQSKFLVIDPPWGYPFGGGNHRNEPMEWKNPRIESG